MFIPNIHESLQEQSIDVVLNDKPGAFHAYISIGGLNYNRTLTFLRTLTPRWKQTVDYECTYQMKLIGTSFNQFGSVLTVSGVKLLVMRGKYVTLCISGLN